MTDRKKPSSGFWNTVALVAVLVLVGYPLSMGPYWWLCHQVPIPTSIRNGMDAFYDPVWATCWTGPEWLRDAIRGYLDWWTRDQPPIPQ